MKINAREKIEMEINFLQEEEDNIWGTREILNTLLLCYLTPKDGENNYKISTLDREYDYKQIEEMVIFLDDLFFGHSWELIKEEKEVSIKEDYIG